MKTQKNNKLEFRKNAIVELNDSKMNNINGGSTFFCSVIVVSLILSPTPSFLTVNDDVIFDDGFEVTN